jgi:hypothetical protein
MTKRLDEQPWFGALETKCDGCAWLNFAFDPVPLKNIATFDSEALV